MKSWQSTKWVSLNNGWCCSPANKNYFCQIVSSLFLKKHVMQEHVMLHYMIIAGNVLYSHDTKHTRNCIWELPPYFINHYIWFTLNKNAIIHTVFATLIFRIWCLRGGRGWLDPDFRVSADCASLHCIFFQSIWARYQCDCIDKCFLAVKKCQRYYL